MRRSPLHANKGAVLKSSSTGRRPIKSGFLAAALLLPLQSAAAERLPIIDMHLHARRADYAGENPPPMCTPFPIMPRAADRGIGEGLVFNVLPPCEQPVPAATTDEQVMRETVLIMERHNMIGMVSGEPELMATWRAAAPHRIIPGLDFRLPGTPGQRHVRARTPADLRAIHARGELRVLAEVMAQYEGVSPDDPRLEPVWAVAEELDIPVGIHMGPGESRSLASLIRAEATGSASAIRCCSKMC